MTAQGKGQAWRLAPPGCALAMRSVKERLHVVASRGEFEPKLRPWRRTRPPADYLCMMSSEVSV